MAAPLPGASVSFAVMDSPANPVAVTGGYGTGATFTLNFGIGPITLTNIGTGYTSVPTVAITGGGGASGAVTANLSVVPSGGTGCATYAGRVWVCSNRTVVFSAPLSYNDFTSNAAGGSFIMVDETLHSTIVNLLSANNFLYIIGQSSIDVVGDVSVSGGVTVFSRTNISSNIGTSQPFSTLPYYRGVWIAATHGFYAVYGSTTQKASDDLDGVYNLIDFTKPVSGGTAVIYKILSLCYLFQYMDPILGSRSLIAVFFNKKWFFVSQRSDLTLIDSTTISGAQTLFATNGTGLYKMFSDTTSPVKQTIVTKLWDMGSAVLDKRSHKIGLELVNPVSPQTITGKIDTEYPPNAYSFSFVGGNYVSWINNSGIPVTWINAANASVLWISSGYAFLKSDVQTSGKYIGVTLTGNSSGTNYSGIHLQYVLGVNW